MMSQEGNANTAALAQAKDAVAATTNGGGAATVTETKGKNVPSGKQGKPGKQKTKEDDLSFWDFATSLGDQWQSGDLKIRVYRVWPRIDVQEDRVYIAIVQEPIDEEYLLRNFGSGRYFLLLRDRTTVLRKHTVSVHNLACPPKVNDAQVVNSPVNEAYFKTWGKKTDSDDDQGKRGDGGQGKRERAENAERGKGETAEILNAVFEKGARIDPALVTLWKEASQQRDELAKQLAEKQTMPPQAPQPDLLNILTQVKQLQGDPLLMLAKLKEFFPTVTTKEPPKPEQNSLDDLKKVLDVFGQAKELFKSEPAAAAPLAPSDC
jgi:hypothetical protein